MSPATVSLSSHQCSSSLCAVHYLPAHVPVGSEHQVHCEYLRETVGHYQLIIRRFFLFFLLDMCVQVLCLYTLGNLCPADVVRDKLVAQGIIPALANCVEVKITRFDHR